MCALPFNKRVVWSRLPFFSMKLLLTCGKLMPTLSTPSHLLYNPLRMRCYNLGNICLWADERKRVSHTYTNGECLSASMEQSTFMELKFVTMSTFHSCRWRWWWWCSNIHSTMWNFCLFIFLIENWKYSWLVLCRMKGKTVHSEIMHVKSMEHVYLRAKWEKNLVANTKTFYSNNH